MHEVEETLATKPLSRVREASQDSALESAEASPVLSAPEGPDATLASRRVGASQPMLTSGDDISQRLEQMTSQFFADFDNLSSRRKKDKEKEKERDSSTGSSTARAPSSGPSTIGRRTLDPLNFTPREAQAERPSNLRDIGFNVGLPPAYVRPRLGSTGSAASNMSIASGEVLGRMDPEVDDERRRSRSGSGREWRA